MPTVTIHVLRSAHGANPGLGGAIQLTLPDEGFFRWRAGAREALAQYGDVQLARLYEASGQELVKRAARAWAADRER